MIVAGKIIVAYDGAYTADPPLGPMGEPSSLAQAIFEARAKSVCAKMSEAVQNTIVDRTTTPPTTNKGALLRSLAADVNDLVERIFLKVTGDSMARALTIGGALATAAALREELEEQEDLARTVDLLQQIVVLLERLGNPPGPGRKKR